MSLSEMVDEINKETGLQVVMVDTSRGASPVMSNLLSQFTAEAVGVRLAEKMNELTLNAPEPEAEEMDFDFEANEGFPTRKPGNAQTRAARKAKKKMQKMSRRANR